MIGLQVPQIQLRSFWLIKDQAKKQMFRPGYSLKGGSESVQPMHMAY